MMVGRPSSKLQWACWRIVSCLVVQLIVTESSTDDSMMPADPSTFFGKSNHASYLDWAQRINYQAVAYLPTARDPAYGAAVHWTIEDDEIEIGLAVRGATGWIGLGMSENGGMRGADIFAYEVAQPDRILDMHVKDERMPLLDTCQDWVLIDAQVIDASSNETDDGFMMVQARRKLDTLDSQDRAFLNDAASLGIPTTRIIAAWGDGKSVAYHGTNDRVRGALRWFQQPYDTANATDFSTRMKQDAQSSFFMGASNYRIPSQETEYMYWCFTGTDLRELDVDLDQGVTVVGFEPIVDQVEHVHHFAVMASTQENNNVDCSYSDYMEFAYTWAPGEPPLALPDRVGLTVGGDSGYKSFLLEIHYDNVNRISGRRDSSGVRYFYTKERRQHAMGIAAIGDPWIRLSGRPVGRDITAHSFICPSSCTSFALKEPVTVLREYLHMHESAISMLSRQIRAGAIVRTGKTEFFDFKQQGMQVVQQEPFQVFPGDSFQLQCTYNNPSRSGDERVFGISSQEEMCISYLVYYPRQEFSETRYEGGLSWMCMYEMSDMLELDKCDAEYDALGEINEAGMERTFGAPATRCMELPEQKPSVNPNVENSTTPSYLFPLSEAQPSAYPSVDPSTTPSSLFPLSEAQPSAYPSVEPSTKPSSVIPLSDAQTTLPTLSALETTTLPKIEAPTIATNARPTSRALSYRSIRGYPLTLGIALTLALFYS